MGLFKNIPERMRQLKPIKWEVLKWKKINIP
jgi:hypothetical protein